MVHSVHREEQSKAVASCEAGEAEKRDSESFHVALSHQRVFSIHYKIPLYS
jgi:hypothetical protein